MGGALAIGLYHELGVVWTFQTATLTCNFCGRVRPACGLTPGFGGAS